MAFAPFKKTKDAMKKKFGKGKGKRQDDDTKEDQEKEAQRMSDPLTTSKTGVGEESESLPDVVRNVHNEKAPTSQPSTSGQELSVGSKKNDLKSTRGSLDSELSDLNLQDDFDQKFPKSSQGWEPAATATTKAYHYGNTHQVAIDAASEKHRHDLTSIDIGEPSNPESVTGSNEVIRNAVNSNQELNASHVSGKPPNPNSEASGDGVTYSEATLSRELNVPDLANADGEVPSDPNSEASRDGVTHSEETHSQELNISDLANIDGEVPPGFSSEASRDEDSVSGHEHHNQEINAATARGTAAPNVNQESAVPAAAAIGGPQNPEETVQSLTGNPIQEEAEDTVDEGATGNETAQQQEAANCYDHLCVSDVITKGKFLEDKLARELDHTSHRVIKTWEHLACTKEVNTPLETRLRCKLNSENSCTQVLIEFLTVEMEDKTVQDLIVALKAINRHDVARIITDVYPDAENSTETISDFASSNANSEMIKEMTTKLDQKSRVIGYWINLGQQFHISGDKLKEIEYGQFNPASALMEYLYSKQEHLTVGKFYEEVKKLKRGDVLKKLNPFLDERSEELMKDVIEPESDVMRGICVCLNNPNRALKNWRHLAYAFNVPREIYKDFNPEKPLSPTKVLFDWIFANRKDLTVGQLCAALKSIDRNDVVRDLRKHLEEPSTGQE